MHQIILIKEYLTSGHPTKQNFRASNDNLDDSSSVRDTHSEITRKLLIVGTVTDSNYKL